MARPIVTATTEELYASLGPWYEEAVVHEAHDHYHLLQMAEALGALLQPVEDVVRDRVDRPGWAIVMDADATPIDWLGWMAQFHGVRLLPGLDDATQRARVKSTDGFRRGSPSAIVGAAQQYLSGTKTVFLVERHGSPYRLTVTTIDTETSDPAAVYDAIKAQKPAGIVLVHAMTTGVNYNALRDTHADYNEVKALYSTYSEVLSNPTKQ